jgi:hypothetical protein
MVSAWNFSEPHGQLTNFCFWVMAVFSLHLIQDVHAFFDPRKDSFLLSLSKDAPDIRFKESCFFGDLFDAFGFPGNEQLHLLSLGFV